MSIVPLFGHDAVRARLAGAFAHRTLPATLLFQGSRGVGKQRLAIWLAQLLLCDKPAAEPCGTCQGCRYVLALQHPDLHWYFPRPRPRDSDPDLEDVRLDMGEAIAERATDRGLYAPPSGMDGIFVATTRLIVQQAAMSPALAHRKVFIIGDAERMVPQEGKDEAANAFLKLLEEPSANTTLILTSSESGALLPTVRSRVVAIRVPPLAPRDIEAFLDHEAVSERLENEEDIPRDRAARISFALGAPGRLLAGASLVEAKRNARRMMDAAGRDAPAHARYEVAWQTASTKARGSFADTLDALTMELRDRAEQLTRRGSGAGALAASRAMDAVEVAKERILTNVSPQLITATLIRELREYLT